MSRGWLPTRADCYEVMLEMYNERKFALRKSQEQMAEHERRNGEEGQAQESPEEKRGEMQKLYAGMYKAAGLPVPDGILSMKRFQEDTA